MSGTIESRCADGVCTITIEHAGKRNAFTYGMLADLADELDARVEAGGRDVLVLRGAGEKAFSSGHDLDQERSEEGNRHWRAATDKLADYPYPTIAMLNGDTYGGAVHVAAACDLRIGRRGARFGITPARIGVVYPPLGIQRITRLLGPAKTKELLFTGKTIDAETAREIGLLNQLTDPGTLETVTYDMAETIASNAPLSLTRMKWIVDAVLEGGSISDEAIEQARAYASEAYESEDFAEGRAAFAEGREPEFEGR